MSNSISQSSQSQSNWNKNSIKMNDLKKFWIWHTFLFEGYILQKFDRTWYVSGSGLGSGLSTLKRATSETSPLLAQSVGSVGRSVESGYHSFSDMLNTAVSVFHTIYKLLLQWPVLIHLLKFSFTSLFFLVLIQKGLFHRWARCCYCLLWWASLFLNELHVFSRLFLV